MRYGTSCPNNNITNGSNDFSGVKNHSLDFFAEYRYNESANDRQGEEVVMEESTEKKKNRKQRADEERERAYEYGLPEYLQHDLDAYKEGLKTGSTLMDCLWGELYGSINSAEIDDEAITPEHAEYLRKKYLWR